MNPNRPQAILVLLVLDGLGLIGVLIFSVLGALNPGHTGYIAGQIVSAALVLGTALLLRRMRNGVPR